MPKLRKKPTTPLEYAIDMAGSEAKLAERAGYSQHAIWAAKKRKRVSADMAVAIEKATDGIVTRQQLRPDLFSAA